MTGTQTTVPANAIDSITLASGWVVYILATKHKDREKGRQNIKVMAPSGMRARRGRWRAFWLTWWKGEQRFIRNVYTTKLSEVPYDDMRDELLVLMRTRYGNPGLKIVKSGAGCDQQPAP